MSQILPNANAGESPASIKLDATPEIVRAFFTRHGGRLPLTTPFERLRELCDEHIAANGDAKARAKVVERAAPYCRAFIEHCARLAEAEHQAQQSDPEKIWGTRIACTVPLAVTAGLVRYFQERLAGFKPKPPSHFLDELLHGLPQ